MDCYVLAVGRSFARGGRTLMLSVNLRPRLNITVITSATEMVGAGSRRLWPCKGPPACAHPVAHAGRGEEGGGGGGAIKTPNVANPARTRHASYFPSACAARCGSAPVVDFFRLIWRDGRVGG